MIESLLTHMPQIYLFLQVTEKAYIDEVLMLINEDVRKQFSNRIVVVSKTEDWKKAIQIKSGVRKCFPGLNVQTNLIKVSLADEEAYKLVCQSNLVLLKSDITA